MSEWNRVVERRFNKQTRRLIRYGLCLAVFVGFLAGVVSLMLNDAFIPSASDPPEIDLSRVHADVARGITSAVQVVKNRPESGLAWGHLGMTLWAHEYANEALICFEQAQRRAPDEIRWPYFRGVILSSRDRSAARNAFSAAANCDPPHPSPLIRLCELHLEADELDKAQNVLNRLLQMAPANAQVYLLAAFHADRRGQPDKAIGHARRALDLAPDHAKVISLLARLLNRSQQREEAAVLNERLRSLPASDEGWADPLMAEVSSFRRDPYWNTYRASQMIQRGDGQHGISLLRTLLDQFPDEPSIRTQLVRTLLNRGKIDDASAVLKDSTTDENFELRLLRATTHLLTEEWALAEKVYQDLIRQKPDSPSMLSEYAFCLRQQGRSVEALDPARQSVRLAPEQINYRIELVRILIELNRIAKAREELSAIEAFGSEDEPRPAIREVQELRQVIGSRGVD